MGLAVAVLALVLASASSCGSGTPAAPSRLRPGETSLQISATPDPVTMGATLTYTVKEGAAGRPGAGQVTVHLPPGAGDIRTAGAAWTCTQIVAEADDYQPAAHTDVACSNASMMAGTPPLTVTIKAPGSPGTIRACAVAAKGASTCVSSRVAE